jgi:hypothetical protein
MNNIKIMISHIYNLINMIYYNHPNVHIDMLSHITLANITLMFKWSYSFINFIPQYFLNYSDNVIPPNLQQDSKIETADVDDCIDELNDSHFKKRKYNLPTFESNYKL